MGGDKRASGLPEWCRWAELGGLSNHSAWWLRRLDPSIEARFFASTYRSPADPLVIVLPVGWCSIARGCRFVTARHVAVDNRFPVEGDIWHGQVWATGRWHAEHLSRGDGDLRRFLGEGGDLVMGLAHAMVEVVPGAGMRNGGIG